MNRSAIRENAFKLVYSLEIQKVEDLDEVELILPLVKEQNSNSFRLNNDRKDDRKELTERQKCIIELLIQEPTLTAKAISEKISEKTSEKFEVSDRTIENDLAQLKKIGILVREGGRKDGRWVVLLSNKELFK